MSSRVVLEGMDEFRRALRAVPQMLQQEADAIVVSQAEAMARSAADHYPEGPTGNLRHGVTVAHDRSRFGVGAIVRSRAKHAAIFEHGTRERRTDRGYRRGRMPKPPETQRFIPKAIRARRQMTSALIGLLERAGFEIGS